MSTVFTWLDQYNTGNEKIDEQHRHLFELANEVVDPENDPQKTHQNVMALYYYVSEHFAAEEAILRQGQCPDYEEHVREHKNMEQKLFEISTGILDGEVSSDDIQQFMRSWLLENFLKRDLKIAPFLASTPTGE